MNWKFNPNDTSFGNYIKFKYDGKIYNNLEEIKKEFKIISKPSCIPNSAVRDGTYAIRGEGYNEKGFYQEVEKYKEFWVEKGKWPNNYIMRAKWELFPKLSPKEYEALEKLPRKVLNKEWMQNLLSYLSWVENRKIKRGVLKSFLRSSL